MRCQEIENVLKLLFVVVSFDFFMFDWFTKCESSESSDIKLILESIKKKASNTYIFSCLTLLSLISRFYCLNYSIWRGVILAIIAHRLYFCFSFSALLVISSYGFLALGSSIVLWPSSLLTGEKQIGGHSKNSTSPSSTLRPRSLLQVLSFHSIFL